MRKTIIQYSCDSCGKAVADNSRIVASLPVGWIIDAAGGPGEYETRDLDFCPACAARFIAQFTRVTLDMRVGYSEMRKFIHERKFDCA